MKNLKDHFKFTLTLALMLSLVVLSGCSSDKKNSTEPDNNPIEPTTDEIVGSWLLTGICSSTGGQTFCVPENEIAADPLLYQINADGTAKQIYLGRQESFNWTKNGSTVTFSGGGMSQSYSCTLTSTRLTLSFDSDGYQVTQSFDRQ